MIRNKDYTQTRGDKGTLVLIALIILASAVVLVNLFGI